MRRLWIGALACLSACSFDSSSSGGGDGSGGPDATTSSTSSTSVTSTTGSTDPSTTETPTSVGETAEPPDDAALLEVTSLDFGPIDVGTSASDVLTVTNVGGVPATDITVGNAALPFSVEETQCGATLGPGETCEIGVDFSPATLGPQVSDLGVAYNDGMGEAKVDAALEGGGAGATRNLIENPSAEECEDDNEDPIAWTDVSGSRWYCLTSFDGHTAPDGDLFFFPGPTDEGSPLRGLMQEVILAPDEIELIDVGELRMEFRAQAATVNTDDDPRRFRLVFFAGEEEIGEFQSGWYSSPNSWEPVVEERIPPATTTRIAVHMECEMLVTTNCSAMFDDLSLRLVYPP